MSIFQSDNLSRFRELLDEPTPGTKVLMILNVVFWVLAFATGLYLIDYKGFDKTASPPPDILVFKTGLKINFLIIKGAWWRLVSSMWVHLGMMHLAFNVYGLFIIAPLIEKFYDTRRMLFIYMVSGLIGSLASFYFVDARSGGASGALYGLVGAMIVFGYKYRKDLPPELGKKLSTGMLPWVLFNIAIGFFDAVPFDNGAHVGGFLGGIALAFIIPARLESRSKISDTFFTFCAVIIVLANLIVFALWANEASNCLPSEAAFLGCYSMPM